MIQEIEISLIQKKKRKKKVNKRHIERYRNEEECCVGGCYRFHGQKGQFE